MKETDWALLFGLVCLVLFALFMWVTWTDRIPLRWDEFFSRHGWRRKR
jgi:hypothetical protein